MLSKKSKYAINALVCLAKQPPGQPILIREISEKQKIPKKFLGNILLYLRNTGIIKSKKGKGGGYYLAKSSSEINLAHIVRFFDDAIALLPCVSIKFYEKCIECENEYVCGIRHSFLIIRNHTFKLLK